MDPNYIAIVAYLVARYLSERVLRLGRQSLSAEEKIRLIDSAASVRSLYLLPAALGMLANDILVRRPIDAVDLVVRDVAVHPLDFGSQLTKH